ncbi:hypothetical protein PAGA_b0125 [Pseudoalteromonas agarivorans DSM 14585]|uniref:Uncharacterized protein n=1 Tax=Pseudoalteromonas agarivorans DSM 14585 TaxID=1312369 RepID=A0ACA8E144_9GAMM|nr:hypothetical protein PAGA_b0125 [Pseudoalteromonas agarivorans DSM 14585]
MPYLPSLNGRGVVVCVKATITQKRLSACFLAIHKKYSGNNNYKFTKSKK